MREQRLANKIEEAFGHEKINTTILARLTAKVSSKAMDSKITAWYLKHMDIRNYTGLDE